MKINLLNLLLASTLFLSIFIACNNDDTPEINEHKGEDITYIKLIASEPPVRSATTRGQTNVGGVGSESKVKNGTFVTTTAIQKLNFTGNNENWESETVQYTGKIGLQKATLLLNADDFTPIINIPDQTITIEDLEKLTAAAGFTMTGRTDTDVDIKPEIAKTAVDEINNQFPFTVERLVSKVQVNSRSILEINLPDEYLHASSSYNYKYSVAGSADKIYLFANKAGSRIMDSNQKYKNFTSAIHTSPATTYEVIDKRKVVKDARKNVTKVSDLNLVASVTDANKTNWNTNNSLPVHFADETNVSQQSGIFFLENSLDKEINKKGDLLFNDITYVKIYTKHSSGVLKWDEDVEEFKRVKPYASTDQYNGYTIEEGNNTYKVEVPQKYYTENKDNPDFANLFTEKEGQYYLKIIDKPGTFYKGANEKLYYSLKDARKDNITQSEKYDGGVMLWMIPANSQVTGTGKAAYTKYADTRRNNIYLLTITGVTGFGKNYDPIDPDDPNAPKPKYNPDEPDKDEVVPVNPLETHIQVKAEILQWNLVNSNYELR